MEACMLCPRRCGVSRADARGFCGQSDTLRVARAAPHFGEEPPVSGIRGSGAIFFSGCTLRCCFCQNGDISEGGFGRDITEERLGDIFLELAEQGVHNINLVSGTQFVPQIVRALARVRHALHIPVLWNSSGYETPETLHALDGLVDIYLPDLKYHSADLARRYSAAGDYFDVASRAIPEMVRQTGAPVFDEDGILSRGTLVRHLVLPGARHDSIALVHWLASRFAPDELLVSIMAQYTPEFVRGEFPELCRRVTTFEYQSVLREAQRAGLRGFSQDTRAATAAYTPIFDLTGV